MISKELMAASTRPLILTILKRGESYGYQIIQDVKQLSGGTLDWSDGMLYPVLHKLEKDGCIQSRWDVSEEGRRRKYYSITDIIVLFSKDFAMLVFIAILLSAPIGYYIISRWLENFAFRIDLSPGIIAIAGGMALIVALLTVSSQLIKAAMMNPVKILRSE